VKPIDLVWLPSYFFGQTWTNQSSAVTEEPFQRVNLTEESLDLNGMLHVFKWNPRIIRESFEWIMKNNPSDMVSDPRSTVPLERAWQQRFPMARVSRPGQKPHAADLDENARGISGHRRRFQCSSSSHMTTGCFGGMTSESSRCFRWAEMGWVLLLWHPFPLDFGTRFPTWVWIKGTMNRYPHYIEPHESPH
jgi:hypothetical protein